ncbi:Hypothetical predicted protein, partial [Paramuricea clavata]
MTVNKHGIYISGLNPASARTLTCQSWLVFLSNFLVCLFFNLNQSEIKREDLLLKRASDSHAWTKPRNISQRIYSSSQRDFKVQRSYGPIYLLFPRFKIKSIQLNIAGEDSVGYSSDWLDQWIGQMKDKCHKMYLTGDSMFLDAIADPKHDPKSESGISIYNYERYCEDTGL